MAVISIDYNEPNVNEYLAVKLSNPEGSAGSWNSGDFVKDWYDCMKFILTGKIGEYFFVIHSSSVDHFIMDDISDKYESCWLVTSKDPVEFVKKHSGEGIEFFVNKGWSGTWEEFKDKYEN